MHEDDRVLAVFHQGPDRHFHDVLGRQQLHGGSHELSCPQQSVRIGNVAPNHGRVLVGVDQVADIIHQPRNGFGSDRAHGPSNVILRAGLQVLQCRQVVLGHEGQHDQRVDFGDLEEIGRVVDDGLVQGDVLLDDEPVVRGLQFHAGPLLQPILLLGPSVLIGRIILHLIADGLNLLFRDGPGLQGILSPADGIDVGLHVALGVEQKDLRHGRFVVLGPLEHLFVQAQLREGVEKIVFLVAQVNAIKHRQEITLLHRVAGLQVAADRQSLSGRGVGIVDLADLHHFGRRETDADADQAGGIEGR